MNACEPKFKQKDKVRIKMLSMKGLTGEILRPFPFDGGEQQYAVDVDGQKMQFEESILELIPSGPLPEAIPVNRWCVCLKGKKDNFKKGERYFIKSLYQDPDGDFMVEVENEVKWNVRAYAKRFNIVGP